SKCQGRQRCSTFALPHQFILEKAIIGFLKGVASNANVKSIAYAPVNSKPDVRVVETNKLVGAGVQSAEAVHNENIEHTAIAGLNRMPGNKPRTLECLFNVYGLLRSLPLECLHKVFLCKQACGDQHHRGDQGVFHNHYIGLRSNDTLTSTTSAMLLTTRRGIAMSKSFTRRGNEACA